MTTTPPGWYHAQGDPDGTVRWWDGTAWSDEPMPPPPGWSDPHAATTDSRFAGAGIRFGAVVIDALVTLLVMLPLMINYLGDVFDDIDAGGDGSDIPAPSGLIIGGVIVSIFFFLMIAFVGGTPGKLILGLRITADDGATTPPGLRRAFLRTLPAFFSAVPGVGQAIGVIVPLAALVMILTDHEERRSIYDRIAGTRVVRKEQTRSTATESAGQP